MKIRLLNFGLGRTVRSRRPKPLQSPSSNWKVAGPILRLNPGAPVQPLGTYMVAVVRRGILG